MSGKPSGSSSSGGVAKGVAGSFYYVNLFTPPIGGVVTSGPTGINCGASSLGTPTPDANGVLQYAPVYYPGADQCGVKGQTQVPWGQAVVLTAVPQGTNVLVGWAGDCAGSGPTCTLTAGADKTVSAIFGPPGSGHGNFMSPALHGPAYFDFLARGAQAALECTKCHGASLQGQGIAPSCSGCHEAAGWTGWSTNCSFCHGARNASTRPGYAVAAHPTWSAPPDAVSQRLSGVPDLSRTGAHQAHLTGSTSAGLQFAAPFTCGTCHAVPADLSHVGGAASRATVVLSGAGQATLPSALGTYDPATGNCATYCHGGAPSPAWAATGLVCGDCHGLPPAPSTGHPSVSSDLGGCAGCHAGTMKSDGSLDLAGGLHLDGIVEATGGHGDYRSPATHGPAFFDSVAGASSLDCKGCHGADYGGGSGPSCNACHAGAGWTGWTTNCSFCHGTRDASTQAGYAVASHPTWSAPPDAISQRLSGVPAPDRTGAHQAHLTGSTSGGLQVAAAFRCETCHAVPANLSHIGGSNSRATVALSGAGQASLADALGSYDPATGNCTTYCHGTSTPTWLATGLVCGSCHGLPPDPATGHPSASGLTSCATCHSDTMNADGTLNLAGSKHVNGVVDATGHARIPLASQHGPMALDYLGGVPGALDCKACHGATYDGGSGPSCNACHAGSGWTGWTTNCSFCHGTRNAQSQAGYSVATVPTLSAPPDDIQGRLTGSNLAARTGAHQAHLTGTTLSGQSYANPIPCQTCHSVPTDLSHIGGSAARATVTLPGGTYSPATGTCATACHGTTPSPTSPAWSGAITQCNGCHGIAPNTGGQIWGLSAHLFHTTNGINYACQACHVTTASWVVVGGSLVNVLNADKTSHVNGSVDVVFQAGGGWNVTAGTCTAACHEGVTMYWR